jgi:hypothetical protein
MSILVVCPGCRKRFNVSEKFAGKQGPCPNCKTLIKIPEKGQEVVIHAPEQFAAGGKSVTGQLLTKPLARMETRFRPAMAAAILGGAILTLVLAWGLARAGLVKNNLPVQAVGLLAVTFPIVVAGYTFLREQEDLDPYRGRALYVRSAICTAIYAALWWALAWAVERFVDGEAIWQWLILLPFLAAGATTAFACFDLDAGSGFLHYSFYLLLTVVLRWVAGMGWIWDVATRAAALPSQQLYR